VTEFLRLNIGAGALGKESGRTINTMRARLAAGESVEIAGYILPATLAAAIENLDLAAMADREAGPVGWFEVVRDPHAGISNVGQQCIERWVAAGADVTAAGIEGRPFWIGQSITLAPDLLTATTQAFTTTG
jgi:hypothetical protein